MQEPADKYPFIPALISIALGNYLIAMTTDVSLQIHITATVLSFFLMVVATMIAHARRKRRATIPVRNARPQQKNRTTNSPTRGVFL